jgi:hypothetical protein
MKRNKIFFIIADITFYLTYSYIAVLCYVFIKQGDWWSILLGTLAYLHATAFVVYKDLSDEFLNQNNEE